MTTAIAPAVADFLTPAVQRTRTIAEPPPRPTLQLAAGTEVPLIAPGSDAWYSTISASKIAAITGRSAWDSPYRLFRVMKGHIEPEGTDDVKAAGHYHEPGIAAWFRDQHPDWTVRPCGTFVAAGNPRHTAAPDRLVYKPDQDGPDLVEIKTTRKPEQWGQPGTDEIPPSYRDQVDWQMHCAGAVRCHVVVEFPWFEYAEYVVDHQPERIAELVRQADAFLARLDAGECPAPDGHPKTLEAQQEVYGEVDKAEGHDFDEAPVRAYVEAVAARKAAETAEVAATTVIVEALAGRKDARFDGKVFAEWKPWRDGLKPKLYAKGNPPTFEATPEPEADPSSQPAPNDPVGERTAWLRGRLKAIAASSDPKAAEAVRRFWPADVPAHPPWTAAQNDLIDALIAQVEIVDDVPFPPSDPTLPTPAEQQATELAERRARQDAHDALDPRRRTIDDDTFPVTEAEAMCLRGTVARLTDPQRAIVVAWDEEGRLSGRSWHFAAGATQRIAEINTAALAAAMHLVDGDETGAVRCALEAVLDLEVPDAWSIGSVLGSLTHPEAKRLTEIALRFAAGDDETCTDIGARLATRWAKAQEPTHTSTGATQP